MQPKREDGKTARSAAAELRSADEKTPQNLVALLRIGIRLLCEALASAIRSAEGPGRLPDPSLRLKFPLDSKKPLDPRRQRVSAKRLIFGRRFLSGLNRFGDRRKWISIIFRSRSFKSLTNNLTGFNRRAKQSLSYFCYLLPLSQRRTAARHGR